MSGVIYTVELWYFVTTVFREAEYVILGYILGVSFIIWSMGGSALNGIFLIFPFVGYVLVMISKLNLNGNLLSEMKKIVLVGIISVGNVLLLTCAL